MNHDSMNKMRLDRRLIGRRGWISSKELAKLRTLLAEAERKRSKS